MPQKNRRPAVPVYHVAAGRSDVREQLFEARPFFFFFNRPVRCSSLRREPGLAACGRHAASLVFMRLATSATTPAGEGGKSEKEEKKKKSFELIFAFSVLRFGPAGVARLFIEGLAVPFGRSTIWICLITTLVTNAFNIPCALRRWVFDELFKGLFLPRLLKPRNLSPGGYIHKSLSIPAVPQ